MNKGLKESHIHISDNVDIINYNINLTSTNNNIILNIPLITTLNKIIDLSLINNHLDNDKIYDLGYGNRLNYFNYLYGDYYSPRYMRADGYIKTIYPGTTNQDDGYYYIGYNEDNDGNYELTSMSVNKYNGISFSIDIYEKYPDYIRLVNGDYIRFTKYNNLLTEIYDDYGDKIVFEYTNNLITKIKYSHSNIILNDVNITYTNNLITKIEYVIINQQTETIYKTINITYYTNSTYYIINGISNQYIDELYVRYSNNKIYYINDRYNTLYKFEYHDDYTKVFDKYNTDYTNYSYKYYVFNDNNLISYIYDASLNYNYFKYDNKERIIYEIEDINLITDNSYNLLTPITGSNIIDLDINKEYTIICKTIGNNTIIINQEIYTFKDIFMITLNNLGNNTEIYISTSFSYLIILSDKDFKKYTYDNKSNITSLKTISGNHTYTYNYYCEILTEEYDNFLITNEYNSNYNLTQTTKKYNNVTISNITYTYQDGNMSSKTDNGNETNYTYLSNSKLISTISNSRIKYEYIRNNRFEITSIELSYINNNYIYQTNSYTYDNYKRISSTTSTETNINKIISKTYTYDNLISSCLSSSNSSNIEYEHTYDNQNRLDSISNNNNELLNLDYNNFNEIDRIKLYKKTNNNYRSNYKYNYDNKGYLTSINLNNNNYVSYQYDQKNRITTITDSISNKTTSLTYDINDNIKNINIDNTFITDNTYDKDNKIKIKSYCINSNTTNYIYNYLYQDNQVETINKDKNINYDLIIFDHNMVSINGIKPINISTYSYNYSYIDTNGIKYNINNPFSDLKFFIKTNITTNQIFNLTKDNYYIKAYKFNNQIYLEIKDNNGSHIINTYITVTSIQYSIYVTITEEYDDTYDEYYNSYYFNINGNEYNIDLSDNIYFNNYDIEIYGRIYYYAYSSSYLFTYNFINNMKYDKYISSYLLDGRITEKIIREEAIILKKQYVYNNYNLISEIKYVYEDGNNSNVELFSSIATYNNNQQINNITIYYHDGGIYSDIYNYTYDDQNRVISDNTKNYEYYNNGNIKKYDDNMYGYNTDGVLTNIDGYPLTYEDKYILSLDEDGREYTWNKDRLVGYGNNVTYTYDRNGIRQSKTVYNNTTIFYYENNKLMTEVINNTTVINYIYDNEELIGFKYNNKNYYYIKDVIGRIIFIIDNERQILAHYHYNAYGVISTLYEDDSIEGINHFKYKSYYYDNETGMYYLITRYYNPSIGRFISPDSLKYIDIDDANKYNLYAYCNNNPVMYSDGEGNFPILACILGITALVGMGLTIGGVASDNSVLKSIGLSMVAIPALISGGIAVAAGIGGATLTGIVGGATVAAGLGTTTFASAEYQQMFTGNNWILDAGMSKDWYNGLMLATASIATLGTFASSFCTSFNIKSINQFGKFGDYHGMRFTTGNGKERVLSFHTHGHKVAHGWKSIFEWHWQLQKWNPNTGKTASTIARWIWWNLM